MILQTGEQIFRVDRGVAYADRSIYLYLRPGLFRMECRGSSEVEQLIRNQQVVGSTPILGSCIILACPPLACAGGKCHKMSAINIFLVAAGGCAGSACRYLAVLYVERRLPANFPYGTLAVNIAGSFILGVVLAWLAGRSSPGSEQWRLLLGTGFCGGFTTFSAFAADNLLLLDQKSPALAILYISLSVVAGVLAVWVGYTVAKALL